VQVQIRDQAYSGANNDAIISVVTGTPASSPVPPAQSADSLVLAQVRVNAGVTSVLNANITDVRPGITAHGGVDVCTSTTKPTLGLYPGYTIWQTDIKLLAVYNGSTWDNISYPASNAAWPTYAAAWTGGVTNPTLGNGTATYKFLQIGKMVHIKGKILMGSTTTFGSGTWFVSLPVTAADVVGAGSCIIFDSSTPATQEGGSCNLSSSTALQFFPGSGGGTVKANNPMAAWASGDILTWSMDYEAA
jgi:hypothetical protein